MTLCVKLPTAGVTLDGHSRAGVGTSIYVHEWRWMFDCGATHAANTPTRVFMSHVHLDHVAFAPLLVPRLTHKSQAVHFYLPAESAAAFEAFLVSALVMDDSSYSSDGAAASERARQRFVVHGVSPGDAMVLDQCREVRVLRTSHVLPSVGFAVYEMKRALLPEFRGRKDIGSLVASGVTVSTVKRIPLIAYLGDTTPAVFSQVPWLLDGDQAADPPIMPMPAVVTECTYLDEMSAGEERGHTGWQELKPIVAAHPRTTFVLTHTSLRHSINAVLMHFNHGDQQGDRFPNVIPWA